MTFNTPNPLDTTRNAAEPAPILKRGARWGHAAAGICVLLGGFGVLQFNRSASPAAATSARSTSTAAIRLCQVLSPAEPCAIPAIDCVQNPAACRDGWKALGPVWGFQEYGQGEYVGRWRTQHVAQYRLRVDDVLSFVFRVTRDQTHEPYRFNIGDEISLELIADKDLKRSLLVLPDGTISVPLLGQVRVADMTVEQVRETLEGQFKRFYNAPAVTVTPIKVDTQLEDLRYTVAGRSGLGGQVLTGRVTPEGTVQLPVVGSVPAQGLTLEEFGRELTARYNAKIQGIEITPVLTQRAPRFVYVLGEVSRPGRFTLEAPTTVMQALAMAGSWNVGANIDQVVVFRRGDDWRLLATMLDLKGALLGHSPCPANEIWVGDSDLVIVPKSKILRTDNFIELVFTKGLYGVFPFAGNMSWNQISSIAP